MKETADSFRDLAEFLIQTYEGECIYFTSDRDRYTFVVDRGFNLPGVKVGEPLIENGAVKRCIQEKTEMSGTIEKNVYGKRFKYWIRPIIENDEAVGCYGVMLHKLHHLARAFPDFAEPLANAFPEGAFLVITDTESISQTQGSQRFEINVKAGGPIVKGGLAEQCLRTGKVVTRDVPPNVYGVSTRGISLPLFDPDDRSLVGTFNLTLPRALAENLQSVASSLSSSCQEIAAVVEEVAASAGKVTQNEGQLTAKVKEVVDIANEIYEVLDFIKGVADQTKMLGLNAAIEAARAGDHGRGFGVVAEEIRKLSDQSKETADRIRKLTEDVNARVHEVSTISGGTLKQSQEQAAATQEVSAAVMELAQIAEKLLESAKSI